MTTLLIAVGSFVGYYIAYHTYGRWLSKKIFNLSTDAEVPSHQLRDDVDFIPTKKEVIFGHHFTSIAGTGPIVGPAIAVFWGWLPALLWVFFGSIFVGAVHDFGALVISLRNRGQTVGDIAGRLISPRARLLFLLILFFALTIVLAIFGLVIAVIFKIYPQSVLSVWIEIPIAVIIGYWVYRKGGGLFIPSIIALVMMYGAIYLGVYYTPIKLAVANPIMVWTILLMIYCFIASVLPVWTLLQPRDYINSHQLMLALGLLVLGIFVAGGTGQAQMSSAPAMVAWSDLPKNAPMLFPFLFITIACGACSGFHCLVSSGTSSKQVACETDAQYVGYGAMLLEGALAVIVILACTAGLGMGKFQPIMKDGTTTGTYEKVLADNGEHITGKAAWASVYNPQPKADWNKFGLGDKVGAFIDGGANFLSSLGLSLELGIGIIAVLVASFAATTLDTATRLQRYVIQELGSTMHIKPLTNKYIATFVALAIAFVIAMLPIKAGGEYGKGGLMLWPLFGATNQLLAGLALMVFVFYLWRRKKAIWFVMIPMIFMLILPAIAMGIQMFHPESGWLVNKKYFLFSFGVIITLLQIWMMLEGILVWKNACGILEEELPPLPISDTSSLPSNLNC